MENLHWHKKVTKSHGANQLTKQYLYCKKVKILWSTLKSVGLQPHNPTLSADKLHCKYTKTYIQDFIRYSTILLHKHQIRCSMWRNLMDLTNCYM